MAAKRSKKLELIKKIINTTSGIFDKDDIIKIFKKKYPSDNVSNGYVSVALKELIDSKKLYTKRNGKTKTYSHDNSWKGLSDKKVKVEENAVAEMDVPVKEQFEMLTHFTNMIIDGSAPSCLIAGMAGIGKTYTVMQQFKKSGLEQDRDYLWISGKASPMGLYSVLHNHRDFKIIFDDCDDVLKDLTCINILKRALDLYQIRTISWYSSKVRSEGLEESFDFTGQVIFISNINLTKIHPALKSRAFRVNIQLTPKQVIDRIKNIMPDIEPNGVAMAMNKKQDALDALLEYAPKILEMGKQIDIRTFNKACLLRDSAPDKSSWDKIKKMILYQLQEI